MFRFPCACSAAVLRLSYVCPASALRCAASALSLSQFSDFVSRGVHMLEQDEYFDPEVENIVKGFCDEIKCEWMMMIVMAE